MDAMRTRTEIERVLEALRAQKDPSPSTVYQSLDRHGDCEEIAQTALDVLCSSAFGYVKAFAELGGCIALNRCLEMYLRAHAVPPGLVTSGRFVASGARAMAKVSRVTSIEPVTASQWVRTAMEALRVATSLVEPFYVEITACCFIVIGNNVHYAAETIANDQSLLGMFREHVLGALSLTAAPGDPMGLAKMYRAACFAIDATTNSGWIRSIPVRNIILSEDFTHALVPKVLTVLKNHGSCGQPALAVFAFHFITKLKCDLPLYHGVVEAVDLLLMNCDERAVFEGMRTLHLLLSDGYDLLRRDAWISRISGVLAKAILMEARVSDVAIASALLIARNKEYTLDLDAALCSSSVRVFSNERPSKRAMYAVRLIRNLARTKHLREKLVEAHVCVVLARNVVAFGLEVGGEYGALCCTAIEALAQDAVTRDALGDAGVCEQVLLFLREELVVNETNGSVSAAAWSAANALAAGHDANQSRLRAAGARDLYRTFGVNASFGNHKLTSLRAWLHPVGNEPVADSVKVLEERCNKAERELQEERSSRAAERAKWGIQECVVCQDHAADLRLLPCQCEVVCAPCWEKLEISATCPACREGVTGTDPVPTLVTLRTRIRGIMEVIEPPRQRRRTEGGT